MSNSYYIDLTGVEDRTELHDRIEQALPVPEWYGRNLDALYDVLTEPSFGGDCLICFTGCAGLGEKMPRYMEAMRQVCSAASEENPGLCVDFWD